MNVVAQRVPTGTAKEVLVIRTPDYRTQLGCIYRDGEGPWLIAHKEGIQSPSMHGAIRQLINTSGISQHVGRVQIIETLDETPEIDISPLTCLDYTSIDPLLDAAEAAHEQIANALLRAANAAELACDVPPDWAIMAARSLALN